MSEATTPLTTAQLRSVLQRIGTAANTMVTFAALAALAADRCEDRGSEFDFHALHDLARHIQLMADAGEGSGSVASLLDVDFAREVEATHV